MARKSVLTLLFITMAGLQGISAAQAEGGQAGDYSVPTGPQPKGALLEEFTGIHCGYCPQGHAIAQQLANACDRVYVVALHAGSYATPAFDQPDYRLDEGEEMVEEFGTERVGYPCGMINRHDFLSSGSPVCSRSMWKVLAKAATSETAPVNLLAKASYDGNTRELKVHVEGYFTAAEQAADQHLNIIWTQSNILGPQNGGLMGDEYVHRHMLRGFITPLWGDTLDTAKQGTYFARDYTITLPESIKDVTVKAEDIEVIAFVTNGKRDVQNVTGCKPEYINYSKPLAGELSAPLIPIGGYWGCNFFEATLKNNSDKTLTEATFSIDINGTAKTATWTGEIAPFESKEITIRTQYDVEDNVQNKYSITLQSLNGQQVEPSVLSGTFTSPREATPEISLKLKTNKESDENTFCIKDADGQTVKEFGPYPTGSVTETTESVTLEPNRIYYLEITDKWGDGIYSPAGYVVVRSSDNSLVDQIYAIDGFGIRSVFRTGKEAVGIEGVSSQSAADADIVVYSTDGTVAYKGKRSAMDLTPGVYIIYDSASRTVSKVTINK